MRSGSWRSRSRGSGTSRRSRRWRSRPRPTALDQPHLARHPDGGGVSAAMAQLAAQNVDGLIVVESEILERPSVVFAPGIPVVVTDDVAETSYPLVMTDQASGSGRRSSTCCGSVTRPSGTSPVRPAATRPASAGTPGRPPSSRTGARPARLPR
ncbi:hypothetical protein NKG05_13965 [Oerskovia sp. M15]